MAQFADATSAQPRLIASAAARLASHRWGCPECAGEFGCHGGSRDCEVCSPPRNPVTRPAWDDAW